MSLIRPLHAVPAPRRPQGMTMVELLVGMAVMLIVLGMTFGIAIESNRATQKITRRQHAINYLQRALSQVCEHLRASVPPEQLTGLANRDAIRPRFESDSLSVPTYDHAQGDCLCMVTISPSQKGEMDISYIQRSVDPVVETIGGGVAQKRTESLGGLTPELFSATIEFGYAQAVQPGQMPEYQSNWDTEKWPDLVRIKVRARMHDAAEPPIELQTAVIPAVLPGRKPQPAEVIPATPSEAPPPAAEDNAQGEAPVPAGEEGAS